MTKDLNLKDFIVRKFTKELQLQPEKTVFDLFEWKTVDVILKDWKTGASLYDERNLEFPIQYSQAACDIIGSKYFKRANVPNDRGKEYSMKQVAHRMVDFWRRSLLDEGILNEETSQIFYDEVCFIVLNQMIAPNSPQWFNTGLDLYNTGEESDGHYYFDEKEGKVVLSKDKYSRTQGSACFILSIEDKLLGDKSISRQYETETRLFKHGSGTGTNFSTLRAKGEKLTGGGTSSGVMSFLKGFDTNAGTIKSGGTSRRAAKMIELDVDHPEIMDFIRWKAKEEQKVRDLGKMDYDISFNGEAYDTVSGQNGNNTIRISNDFMLKVDKLKKSGKDSDHLLKGRKDDSVNKTIKVSELWNEFNRCSWECADPAPQFSDTFNQWHTCPNGEDGNTWAKHNGINGTNPCSEYAFLDDTSCNLASINLLRFWNNETKVFDIESYLQTILLGQLILEATVNKGQFPTEDVARRTHLFRTTGLGIANLAGLLLVLGLSYDSDESRNIASSLMSICTGYSYFTSSLMAKQIGAFAKYEINKPYMLEVIRNHARVSGARDDKYERLTYKPVKLNHSLLNALGFKYLSDSVKTIWINTIKLGEEYGFRNAQTTVIAPTGTIAFAMDCEATSTEPFFAHIIYKKLSSGGGMSIVNPLIPLVLRNLGYSEEDINIINDKITAQQIESCPQLKEEHLPIFDTANKCGSGTRYIQPIGHVKMMAALTPMVSGAISKTVNLPNNATVNDFEQVQLESWRLGVKGIALYRDNCKASQPLNSTDDTNSELKFEDMKYKDLVKIAYDLSSKLERPVRNKPKGILDGHKHCAVIDGLKLQIKLFRYQDTNKICEIYVTADAEGTLAKGLLDSLSKQTSKMLQYNAPITDVIKSLKGQKYEPHGFVTEHPYIKFADSISDLLAKILEIEIGDYSSCQIKPEGYVKTDHDIIETISKTPTQIKKSKEGTKVYGKTCTSCGSSHMRKNGTCYVCEDCGTTTGCS